MKFIKTNSRIFWLGVLLLSGLLIFVLGNWPYFGAKLSKLWPGDSNQEIIDQVADKSMNQIELGANRILIPSLGIDAPIKFVAEASEPVFQEALQNGVVQYPGTALAGEVGNTYIFGHSSDFVLAKGDYKTVFVELPNIQTDAEIYISNQEGQTFKYQVFEQFVAENTDTHLLSQDTDGETILTLQTSYPIGTALKRYIVKAKLVIENRDK